jgi:hypothetical protein
MKKRDKYLERERESEREKKKRKIMVVCECERDTRGVERLERDRSVC